MSTTQVESWLQPETFLVDVDVRDGRHALAVIADAIAEHHALDPDYLLRALSRREAAASTAVGGGFAIPHARIGGLDRPLTLLLRPRSPIAFRAPDHRPVSLMLAIMVPEDGNKEEHLQLLSLVARLFSEPRFRRELDDAHDAESMSNVFAFWASRLTNV